MIKYCDHWSIVPSVPTPAVDLRPTHRYHYPTIVYWHVFASFLVPDRTEVAFSLVQTFRSQDVVFSSGAYLRWMM